MSNSPPRPVSKIPNQPPSSPKRKALHQRSEPQENASAPTIRFVTEPNSKDVYGKTPFPFHPSQILHPRHPGPVPAHSHRVSVSNENANYASTIPTKSEALLPSPLLSTRNSNLVSDASDLDTSFDTSFDTYGSTLSPLSSRFSSRTSPPTSLFADEDRDRTSTRLTPVLERITSKQSSSSASKSTIRPVIPSGSNVRVQDVVKHLETSLATSSHPERPGTSASSKKPSRPTSSTSSDNYVVISSSSHATPAPKAESSNHSADTLHSLPSPTLRHKPKGLSSPQRLSKSPTRAPSSPKRAAASPTQAPKSPPETPKALGKHLSQESVAFSDVSYSTDVGRPRTLSSPELTARAVRAAIVTGAKLQYSAIRAPSASASWAEVSRQAPTSTPRMNDGPSRPPVWSSRLSTIPSESTRTTQSGSSSGFAYQVRRRTIGSVFSDEVSDGVSSFEYGSGVLTGTESNISIPIPHPLFSAERTDRSLPPAPGQEFVGRDSDEVDDTLGELHVQPLRNQRSFLSRFSATSRPGSAESGMSSRSQLSFMGDLSWARRYYSGEHPNLSRSALDISTDSGYSTRLNTADTTTSGTSGSPTSDTLPTSLWRPRTRPFDRPRNGSIPRPSETRGSAMTEASEAVSPPATARSQAVTLSVNEMMYSPHLRRDRQTANRYSVWAAPSFEEPFVRSLFGPTGRQLLLFVLGFIVPPLWMLAAFLPLPKRPSVYAHPDTLPSDAGMSEIGSQAYPNSVVPSENSLDERRWQKASWWRRMNRIMSLLGLLIIGAVVALAIVGTQHKLGQSSYSVSGPLRPLSTGTTGT